MAFRDTKHVGTHSFIRMTGLNPFTLSHCGPSPPCVRFAATVTDCDATLSTQCLARVSGAGTCLWLTKPSLARRTSIGANIAYVRSGSVRRRCGNEPPDRVSYPFLRMVDSTGKGHEWNSISIRIKRNNSETIPTAKLTVRSVRTIFGPIVVSIIKYIVMPASIFGSLPWSSYPEVSAST
jgi:hypothetical protein